LLDALDSTEDTAEEASDEMLEASDEADEAPEAAAEEALPLVKIVVDPTVVSKVEESLVTVETIAEVVIADEDSSVPLGVL